MAKLFDQATRPDRARSPASAVGVMNLSGFVLQRRHPQSKSLRVPELDVANRTGSRLNFRGHAFVTGSKQRTLGQSISFPTRMPLLRHV